MNRWMDASIGLCMDGWINGWMNEILSIPIRWHI